MQSSVSEAQNDPQKAGGVIDELDASEGRFAHYTTISGESVPQLLVAYNLLERMLGGLYETYHQKHDACLTAIGNGVSDCNYSLLEQLELRALYSLSWLRFHGSILFDVQGVRRRILNQAIAGFTQSALIILSPDLVRENLLGRAYCERDLGQFDRSYYKKAIADFHEVMRTGPGSAQYGAAAQGLATTYAAMGDVNKAAALSSRLAQGKSRNEAQSTEMFRLQELFKAEAETTNPVHRAEIHRELLGVLRRAYGNKRDWSLVLAAVVRDVSDPGAEFGSSKEPLEQYLLAEVLASTHRQLAAAPHYLAAARSGDYPQGYNYAIDIYYSQGRLDLIDAPLKQLAKHHDPMSEWAAYMRFKIARTRWERSGMRDPMLNELWIAQARECIDQYPHGKYAYEPRFRLAELLQDRGKYSEALAQYDLVKGDRFYDFGATFKASQCRYLILGEAPVKQRAALSPEEKKTLISQTIAGLSSTIANGQRIEMQVPAESPFVRTARGQATYMLAALLEAQPHKDYDRIAPLLDGFETDYPQMGKHFQDVTRWRLGALERTGQYAVAQAEITDLMAPGHRPPADSDFIKALGLDLWKRTKARAEQGDKTGSLADAKLTAQLYQGFESQVADGKMDARSLTGTLSILGETYVMMNERARAKVIFEQVVKAAPASPDANAGLARLAQADHDTRSASEFWTRVESEAAESDDLWYEARYNLALIYASDGNVNAACRKLAETRSEHPGLGSPELKQRWDGLQRKLCLHQGVVGNSDPAVKSKVAD